MSFPRTSKDQPDGFEMVRAAMIARLKQHYGITDERVIEVMQRLPRHMFVPDALRPQAYKDNALPISSGQTISQPYIVAKMTQLLELVGTEKVLEVGSGTGYQTAVLASLARKVFAIERLPNLVEEATARMRILGIRNVTIKTADGTTGWDAYHPYDAILVAAGGPLVPEPLVKQLRLGGRMVIPVGDEPGKQMLIRVTRTAAGSTQENFGPCSFVPLIGEFGWK
jgi:protein-L-isoaspartate(D-aspartate) O-methyltransferase